MNCAVYLADKCCLTVEHVAAATYCTAYLFCTFGDAVKSVYVVRMDILKPNFKQRLCVSG